MASTSRRRSDQSPPQSTSQYQGRLLGADPKDPKLEQVPSSYTDDGQITASSDRHFRTSSLISVARQSHHDRTNSRLESRPSFGIQPVFSPQGGKSGVKNQFLYKPVHNGYAEVSPISRLPPTSVGAGQDDQAGKVEEEEHEAIPTAESEESSSPYQKPMTAAERRAEKRKAKRFRSVFRSLYATIASVLISKG
ncbi:MAG: hypothetical protein LQ347_000628 [Umbilicaria vellea]|nr:MAG: hypothetical protein LQ347_000628 [Umbilicaria vellea]